MNHWHIFSIITMDVMLTACGRQITKSESEPNTPASIQDVTIYPQAAGRNHISSLPNINLNVQKAMNKRFNKIHFSLWLADKIGAPQQEVLWGHGYATRKATLTHKMQNINNFIEPK